MAYKVNKRDDSVTLTLGFDQLYALTALLAVLDGEFDTLRWLGQPPEKHAADLDDIFQDAAESYLELTGDDHPAVEDADGYILTPEDQRELSEALGTIQKWGGMVHFGVSGRA